MSFVQDFRHALRALARRPGFTAVALAMLALGIGANTAIFSVVHAVLLAPLPYEDAEELAFLTRSGDVSIPDGVDWRAESESFESIALLLRGWDFDLTGDGEPERLTGSVIEPQLFDVLRVQPLRGRRLTPEDNRLGGERVAVISAGLWQRRFGGDPQVVGRTLRLSGHETTIVGVAPPELDFLDDGVDLWVPVAVETPWAVDERGTNNFDAVGRLAAGATLEEARAEMLALSERLAEEYPKTNNGKIVRPIGLLDFRVQNVRPALLVLSGAVALVLLVASLNLVALLLARSISRRRDFATRRSLGAPRRRIVQQMVGEGLALALPGGALGVLLAVWGTEALLALAPATLPRAADAGVDWPVLGFAFALATACGVLVGLLPALHVVRKDPGTLLAGGRTASEGRGGQRLLGGLVAAEVALACLLLVGCGLLIRSLHELGRVDLGFEPRGVLLANLVLPESRYGERDAQSAAFTGAVEAIAALPGVEAAASVIGAPLSSWGTIGNRVLLEGQPPATPGEEPGARGRPVTGDFFRALGQPILEGRPFHPTDDEEAPRVAIVNRGFAREHFGEESPLGRRIAWRADDPKWMTIVGVAADVKSSTVADEDEHAIYTPYRQRQAGWQRFGTLVVRTAGDPAAFVRPVQQAVWSVDPTLPLADVETLEQRLASSLAQERFNTLVLGFFAAVALALAVLGIYGVLAFAVERRRREIGVRKALGADRGDLLTTVIGRGMTTAALGLALGLAAALLLGRAISALLFQVEPTDVTVFAATALSVAAGAFLGCYLPARRASRIDPVVALRDDG